MNQRAEKRHELLTRLNKLEASLPRRETTSLGKELIEIVRETLRLMEFKYDPRGGNPR
jgi:hypothetical protein